MKQWLLHALIAPATAQVSLLLFLPRCETICVCAYSGHMPSSFQKHAEQLQPWYLTIQDNPAGLGRALNTVTRPSALLICHHPNLPQYAAGIAERGRESLPLAPLLLP